MKFIYSGESERVFPTIAVTVNQGDIFEAPEDFTAPEVSSAEDSPVKSQPEITPLATNDSTIQEPTPTVGDEK